MNCDDGVVLGIAESRESPSTIVNHKIDTIREDLRSLWSKLDDTRDGDRTIRAIVRNSLAKTRPCDNTNETIRDDEDSAIRDEKKRDDTRQKERCTTTILKKWAPGASNRATLIYSTNLKISPAAPRSICKQRGVIDSF